MKVVIAESNPDMELLTQHFASAQTFWLEQLDASDDNVNSLCQWWQVDILGSGPTITSVRIRESVDS